MSQASGAPVIKYAILATDGSPYASAATAFAGALAWPAGATISVARLLDAPDPGGLPVRCQAAPVAADWSTILEHTHPAAHEEVTSCIADAAETLRAQCPGVEIDEVFRVGEPVAELLSLARSSGAELMMVGARGRTVLERLLLGSVSEGLVAEASCPVLIVREEAAEIRVVLVALRSADDADRLADACLRLPLPPAAKLVAVTASAPQPPGGAAARPRASGAAEAPLAARGETERAGPEAAGLHFVERIRAGDPERPVTARVIRGNLPSSALESRAGIAPALLREAEALGADLIVVGAREQPGGAAKLGLGSVTRKLVRRAPRAILVVRDALPSQQV
ncbi:MAG: universal stress protein [Thermomicrobiales bacterium]|nr:universal stress protein [Thermomicrobiales bacterium]